MSAFKPAWPLGLGINDEILAAALNALDQDHVKTPNFVDGGATYSPAAQIIVGGTAGLLFNCPVGGTWATPTTIVVTGPSGILFAGATRFAVGSDPHVLNGVTFQVDAGGTLTIAQGAKLEVSGTLDIAAGATVTVEGSIGLSGTGKIIAFSGAALQFGAGTVVEWDGQTTFAGPIIKVGSAAAEVERFLTLPNATPQTIDTRSDIFEVPPVLAANATYDLSPGTHPGQHITVFRFANLSPHSATIIDTSPGPFVAPVTIAGGIAFWVELYWLGTGWKPVRWSQSYQTAALF